jgi:hypothetical protein
VAIRLKGSAVITAFNVFFQFESVDQFLGIGLAVHLPVSFFHNGADIKVFFITKLNGHLA